MKIAVVGSGAAGLSAFWALNEHSEHEVYLYEKEGRLGGHANAITVQVPGKEPCSVDTAFIMLNKEGYPTFWSFLDRLKIPLVKTDTSFSVSQGAQAWGSSFNGLFATPGSALKPRLWRMMFDLFRFHYACLDLLKPEVDESVSVGEYLDTNKYGDGFREDYLLPLAATFWSLPPERVVRECPIKTLVRNFHNHSLLQLWSRFTWYTIAGGSRSYIDRIVQNVPSERIRLSTPIQSMTKTDHGIEVIEGDGATNTFDHVIMATHADTTLRILQRGNLLTARDEKSLLDACDWSQFEIVMHHDESAMPANQGVWSAWNTLLPDTDRGVLSPNPQDDSVSCTFDMNLLHAVPAGKHGRIFGTLNPPEPIDPSKVFGRFSYSTPIFTTRLIDTQRRLDATAHTRFASGLSLVGAWMGLGTHEDAWEGGIAAARSLGADVCLTKRGKDRDVLESKVDWVIKWVLIVMGMLIAELEVLLVVVGEKLVRRAKDF